MNLSGRNVVKRKKCGFVNESGFVCKKVFNTEDTLKEHH